MRYYELSEKFEGSIHVPLNDKERLRWRYGTSSLTEYCDMVQEDPFKRKQKLILRYSIPKGDELYVAYYLAETVMSSIILSCHTDCSLSGPRPRECNPEDKARMKYFNFRQPIPEDWNPVGHSQKEGNVVGLFRHPTGRGWNCLDSKHLSVMNKVLNVILTDTTEKTNKIINYYKLGVRLERTEPSMSYLSFYKVIELRLGKMNGTTNAENLVSLSHELGYPREGDSIATPIIPRLAKIRNHEDVAHPATSSRQLGTLELSVCKRFAHEIIYDELGITN